MKCEVCLELLEEYLDGELPAEDQEQISGHLMMCAECAAGFAALTAEQDMFSRYERELEVPPFLWTRIAQHTVAGNSAAGVSWRARLAGLLARPAVVGAVAVLLLGIAIGVAVYLPQPAPQTIIAKRTEATVPRNDSEPGPNTHRTDSNTHGQATQPVLIPKRQPKRKIKPAPRVTVDQSGVLSSDIGYLDIDERETARHIEQTQLLLRSIRNVNVSDGDEEIDVSYDKALSRRLLNENVVLRRDAEMKAKFPTKSLLADVEPFLIDIANLPDHARPEEVRAIKERVQKTEIVAALMGYQERSPNNR